MNGMIVNAGHQSYSFSGGLIAGGEILGTSFSPGSPVAFSFSADVVSLSTHGSGSVTVSSGSTDINVAISINGETPAAVFPINPLTLASCDPSTQHCTSEIPLFFNGIATITETGLPQAVTVPVVIESPYWNANGVGGPIIITSTDSGPAIFLAVVYSQATIDWKNVQLQGTVSGTLGGQPVTGSYSTVSNSHEDLVAGSETDSHHITFSGMSVKSLNGPGSFTGVTDINPNDLAALGYTNYDCTSAYAAAMGFSWPFGPGTCLLTGAYSTGNFQMNGAQGAKISGSYTTFWSVPSEFTITTVTAAVAQH